MPKLEAWDQELLIWSTLRLYAIEVEPIGNARIHKVVVAVVDFTHFIELFWFPLAPIFEIVIGIKLWPDAVGTSIKVYQDIGVELPRQAHAVGAPQFLGGT